MMVWNTAWLDAVADALESEEYAQADLDHLLDMKRLASADILDRSFHLFDEIISRLAARPESFYAELAIPLRTELEPPRPGVEDLQVLDTVSYPGNLLGVSIPGYYIRKTDPRIAYRPGNRSTRIALVNTRPFARDVYAEYRIEEWWSEDYSAAWLSYIAPIATDLPGERTVTK